MLAIDCNGAIINDEATSLSFDITKLPITGNFHLAVDNVRDEYEENMPIEIICDRNSPALTREHPINAEYVIDTASKYCIVIKIV